MRVPVSWLREFVEFKEPIADVADRLATSTLEVERIVRHGVADADGNLGLFRVGRVLEAGKHPNADRLQLCQVDIGEAEPRQIVCGAWNFGAGASVAVALPGAILPDGRTLERAKLRGSVSDGMILSEQELELGTDHAGILVLDDSREPGTPLTEVLPLSDDVLEVESTGNRPDLLSIYGVAREVAALLDVSLMPPPGRDPEQLGDESVDIRVEDLDRCPRYIGRLFRNVRVGPSSPWLKARLLAAGMRPISNVVDVTNYVMIALGSPLHAFDHATLRGGRIIVRRAVKGEELRTLDGALRKLATDDLVIADESEGIAVAGIMGGEETEVQGSTTDLLLEAANFEPTGILKTSERLHLRTDSSNRWEKGVSPDLAKTAAIYATQLIAELSDGLWVGASDVHDDPPDQAVITLRPDRTSSLMGLDVPASEQKKILGRLGFVLDDEFGVAVPTWRARDITREIDLIEEIARFKLDEIAFTLPTRRRMFGRLTRAQALRRAVEDVLVGAGLTEAYTSSLVAKDQDPAALYLSEALSTEHAVLRTSLLTGLLEAAQHNADMGNSGVALFEIARVYLPSGGSMPDERWRVGGILESGFFAAKGALETLYSALKVEPLFDRTELDFLHPGKAAGLNAGWVGELHPTLLDGTWSAFELDLETLFAELPDRLSYAEVSSFPPVRQDLAFIVEEATPAGELVEVARVAVGAELHEIEIFDVYRGDPIPAGEKSVAIAVAFQSSERTLADDDARVLRDKIVSSLAEQFGARLRA